MKFTYKESYKIKHQIRIILAQLGHIENNLNETRNQIEELLKILFSQSSEGSTIE